MSIKIYDAYKINISSVGGLRDFTQTLAKEYFEYQYGRYVKATATAISVLSEYAPYLEQKDADRHEKMIREAARLSLEMVPSRQIPFPKAKEILKDRPLSEIARQAVCNEWKDKYSQNVIDASIVAFPCPISIKRRESNNPTLILAVGQELKKFLQQACKASHGTFDPSKMAYKYALRDWHYQNQSDKPENVTDEEWKLRAESWAEAMPSEDPRKDGLTISVLDKEMFMEWLSSVAYDYEYPGNTNSFGGDENKSRLDADILAELGDAKNIDRRLTRYAEADALDEYVSIMHKKFEESRTRPMAYSKLKREFDEIKNDPSSIAYGLIGKYKDLISKYMIDFSTENPLKMCGYGPKSPLKTCNYGF